MIVMDLRTKTTKWQQCAVSAIECACLDINTNAIITLDMCHAPSDYHVTGRCRL